MCDGQLRGSNRTAATVAGVDNQVRPGLGAVARDLPRAVDKGTLAKLEVLQKKNCPNIGEGGNKAKHNRVQFEPRRCRTLLS